MLTLCTGCGTQAWSTEGGIPGGEPSEAAPPVELQLNGVSWGGLESSPCVLGGLHKRASAEYWAGSPWCTPTPCTFH